MVKHNLKPGLSACKLHLVACHVRVSSRIVIATLVSFEKAKEIDVATRNLPLGAEIVRADNGVVLATLCRIGGRCGWILEREKVA